MRGGSASGRVLLALLASVGATALARAQDPEPTELPEVRVIATTPLSTVSRPRRTAPAGPARVVVRPTGQTSTLPPDPALIDRDKVPSSTQTLTAEDFSRTYTPSVTQALMQRVPGVSTTDVQGNGFTQDLRYRGFAASPLQGTPQGIAVYMNGIRLNEAFGDTVNWDLIPTVAIERADMWSSNPVFGLNALGGAVNMQMKNGFIWQGFEGVAQGGSHARINGSTQYGARSGDYAVYFAAEGLRDQGWRYQSPSELKRLYGDIGWRNDISEIHLVASAARNHFGVVGPTPIDLLARDWRSIYTWPQTTQNQVGLLALNGKFAVSETWSIQSNVYVRKFKQQHVDGNDAELERCSGQAANPLFNTLCLDDDGFPAPVPAKAQFQILNANNQPIPCPPGPGNQCNITPYGTVDRTNTDATTVGASLQGNSSEKLFGHDNQFTIGGSIDHSRISFGAKSELGYIYPNLFVGQNPAIPGTGQVIHTLGNLGYSPVDFDARNTYYGLYVTDTFDITPRLSATAGARLNVAQITMADLNGTSPDLNGSHRFQRVNPVAGLTYKLMPGLTAYGGYAEANRVPTPLELGCANPARPCLLEGFLVSDPPLQQVVARTWEGGLRGEREMFGGRLEWKFGGFRADSSNDIINVASQIQGRGVYRNVDATRRQGLEAGAQFQSPQWLVYANYSFIDATYQFAGDIASPNNPSADADGNIHVVPGDRLPMIPRHQFKAGVDYAVTPAWRVGADLVVVGSQVYVGDDANQNARLPAYWVVNLHTSYQLTKDLQIFGVVNNLFDRRYAVYGTYFEPQSIANAIPNPPTDQRMQTPAQPFAIYAGLKVRLP
jgi:iron complex outermembrane receptor protein